ncbi:divalent-cation tolerance protein CutA [Micromonospora sediminimaris]|uniref:divalent-cation tolerance protein CutA n=1 Tax=Micromonospora sediminimaris TaxID=547162 RepID=UPI0037A65CE0
MSQVLYVYTAAGSLEVARRLAQGAVRERLAAGGQVVGPVESVFWHEGSFGTGQEWQVVLRTSAEVYPRLERHLKEHHEWSNPEVVAVAVLAGAPSYLQWLHGVIGTGGDAEGR